MYLRVFRVLVNLNASWRWQLTSAAVSYRPSSESELAVDPRRLLRKTLCCLSSRPLKDGLCYDDPQRCSRIEQPTQVLACLCLQPGLFALKIPGGVGFCGAHVLRHTLQAVLVMCYAENADCLAPGHAAHRGAEQRPRARRCPSGCRSAQSCARRGPPLAVLACLAAAHTVRQRRLLFSLFSCVAQAVWLKPVWTACSSRACRRHQGATWKLLSRN